MKFTNVTTSLWLLAILTSSLIASASPVGRRDVYVPPILSPSQGEEWIVGENRTVKWDVTSPPNQITNKLGRIQLRKGDMTLPIILADDFDILFGSVAVTVPRVIPGEDYRIVLFGDSGNWSPPFSISSR